MCLINKSSNHHIIKSSNQKIKIAIIGTGNVGGALATKWPNKGHEINLSVRDTNNFKGKELLNNANIKYKGFTYF